VDGQPARRAVVDLFGLLPFGFLEGGGELLARDETYPDERRRQHDDAIDQPDRYLTEIEGLRMIRVHCCGVRSALPLR
jgi:hypothetical protein